MRNCLAALLLCSLGVTSLASAQGADERTRAREAYARGQELFREGSFVEAEAAFREAYETIPLPVVLLGIAEALERQGDAAGTVETLERYLAERADAPDRRQVEERIAEIRARPATLVITTSPPGATVSVNDQVVARLLGHAVEHEVEPGQHVVSAELSGYESASQSVEATFGTRHEVDISLEQSAAAPPVDPDPGLEPPSDTEPDSGDGAISTEVWIAGGVALAGVAAGSVLGMMALSKQSDFDDSPDADTADAGERLALFADLSFGIAAVAGVTAAVLLLTSGSADDEEGDVAVTPVLTPTAAGLAAATRF